jgi:hypothetical protein
MVAFGRAGLRPVPVTAGFAPPTGAALGNDLPANTGTWQPDGIQWGPGPHATGGRLGGFDGFTGSDPRSPQTDPEHRWVLVRQGGTGQRPGGGPSRNANFGIAGFSNKLSVQDRHAYWDAGYQRTGVSPSVPGNPPNNQSDGPPLPALRVVNRSLNPQIGSSNTAAQDDLSRPYTWLGEQGSGWSPVYGGVPGLRQPYGSRGGVPYPTISPVPEGGPGDGPQSVFAGPPHGLHSVTLGGRWQTIRRYAATPQMRPVRADRPSNSPQAGQSYSQTVQHQGAASNAQPGATRAPAGVGGRVYGRPWSGS